MEGILVYKRTFDSSENHNPISEELLGTFVSEGTLSAHGVAGNFISSMEPFKHYLGYDGKVYPQIHIQKTEINPKK